MWRQINKITRDIVFNLIMKAMTQIYNPYCNKFIYEEKPDEPVGHLIDPINDLGILKKIS